MPRILVVDDDRDTCRFIAEVLAAPGREFELAAETDRALHLARTEPFDLVVCDINLNSSLNGLDVLRAFKARESRRSGFARERIWHAGDRDRSGPRGGIRLHQ